MHFTVRCVAVVLASITSIASAAVGSSVTGTSTSGSDLNFDSGSGEVAYAVPGDNDKPDDSSDPDSELHASTLEYVPESDNTISTSDPPTQLSEVFKSLQIANNPTYVRGPPPMKGDCEQDRSGCNVCVFLPNGKIPCGWFDARCDPTNKNYCILYRYFASDESRRGGVMELDPTLISHIPTADNPNGQKWCKDCPQLPVQKPETP